jgi:hypothetical protein
MDAAAVAVAVVSTARSRQPVAAGREGFGFRADPQLRDESPQPTQPSGRHQLKIFKMMDDQAE